MSTVNARMDGLNSEIRRLVSELSASEKAVAALRVDNADLSQQVRTGGAAASVKAELEATKDKLATASKQREQAGVCLLSIVCASWFVPVTL